MFDNWLSQIRYNVKRYRNTHILQFRDINRLSRYPSRVIGGPKSRVSEISSSSITRFGRARNIQLLVNRPIRFVCMSVCLSTSLHTDDSDDGSHRECLRPYWDPVDTARIFYWLCMVLKLVRFIVPHGMWPWRSRAVFTCRRSDVNCTHLDAHSQQIISLIIP